MEIQWLGHSAFRISAGGRTVVIDPFFSGNPQCPPGVPGSLGSIDHILVTHGHGDHVGDTVELAKTSGAQVVAIADLAGWLGAQGVQNCVGMNKGGTVKAGELAFSMVHARHSSSLMIDGKPVYMGDCAGFVVHTKEGAVYHLGDTELFSDLALVQRLHRPRVALVPIGGHYTMDARAAAIACNEFLDCEVIVPMHYATFPVLAEDAQSFAREVKRGRVAAIQPGETLSL